LKEGLRLVPLGGLRFGTCVQGTRQQQPVVAVLALSLASCIAPTLSAALRQSIGGAPLDIGGAPLIVSLSILLYAILM